MNVVVSCKFVNTLNEYVKQQFIKTKTNTQKNNGQRKMKCNRNTAFKWPSLTRGDVRGQE